jgi:hypothetical protein
MQCTHNRAREVTLQLLCSEPLADGVVIPRNGFPPIGPKGGEALVSERYVSGHMGLPSRKPRCGPSRAGVRRERKFY